MSSKTLVIVPTYNERDNLAPLAARLLALPVPVDMLVVDDNSPDGTGKVADELASKHPRIHVLHRTEKNGLGRAYCAGFAWALERDYEFIFEMDGDFSHNPDDVPKFLEAAQDADLVLGSRYGDGIRVVNWPLSRLMLSKGAAKYVRIVTGMPFTDPTGGYKCFRRRALQAIDLHNVRSNGYSFQIEMTHKLWRQGMKIVEVPIIFTDRFQGTSKMSTKIMCEAFFMVWRLWVQNGFRRSPGKPRIAMRKRAKILLIVVAALFVIGSVVAWQRHPLLRAYCAHRVRAVTSSLPSCDRVEVFHLNGETSGDASTGFPVRPYEGYSRILDRKTLTRVDAESLAALWRSQTFGWEYQALCHGPVYGFRFYRGSSLKFETSVCFHCGNFYVTALGQSGWWGFDTKTTKASNFLARLQQIFPASVPKPETK